jgi:membrane protein DedA with SNARE-associated domain
MGDFVAIVERFPYPGLFLLPILGSAGFPIPEDAILILCGILISKKVIATFPGLAAVYIGILVSDLIIYTFGKKYCRRILSHRKLQKIFPPEKLILLEQKFIRSGPFLILVCRQIFWLRAKLFLVAGIMKMPLHRFIIVDAIAALFTAGIMVTLGYAGCRSFHYVDIVAQKIAQMAPQLAVILPSILLAWWFLYWRQRKTAGIRL